MKAARYGLQQAVTALLQERGGQGRPLSLREAARRTGLSPATVGEMAKGIARTAHAVYALAHGLEADPRPFLLLAGFLPEEAKRQQAALTLEEEALLLRVGKALAALPCGIERTLFAESLHQSVQLMECFTQTNENKRS